MPGSPHVLFSGCLARSRTLHSIKHFGCLKAVNPFMDLARRASSHNWVDLLEELHKVIGTTVLPAFPYVKGTLRVYSAVSKMKTFSETETQLH